MEKDIVERLREVLTVRIPQGYDTVENGAVVRRMLVERQEAADEIEGLRKIAYPEAFSGPR